MLELLRGLDVEAWLRAAGLADADLDALRARMLELGARDWLTACAMATATADVLEAHRA